MKPLRDTDTLEVPPNVMARAVGEELVLLHLDSGRYFGLDPIGTHVWNRFLAGDSAAEVAAFLVVEFGIEAQVALADITALVSQLAEQGLVAVRA